MKVTYLSSGDVLSVAYLDDEPLRDGSFMGADKHTDMPVHLRWDEMSRSWVEVCQRSFQLVPPLYETFVEVGERPDCMCVHPDWDHDGPVDGSGSEGESQ